MIDDLWYKNAVIYCLDVGTFMDANGDGVGDFEGLMRRLDYLAGPRGHGASGCCRSSPRPNRDNGYDITDYYGVDPRYGTLGRLRRVHARRRKQRGIRVIIDLVVNHTSDQHPWFQAARTRSTIEYRDWYCWSKKKPPGANKGMVFPGVQKSTWTYDRGARDTTSIASTTSSPTSTPRTPRSRRRSGRSWASGSSSASRAFAWTRSRS